MYLVELVKLQILFWMLEIRDIFGVNGRCWGRPKYKKNMSVPPSETKLLYKASDLITTPPGSFSYGCSVAVPV